MCDIQHARCFLCVTMFYSIKDLMLDSTDVLQSCLSWIGVNVKAWSESANLELSPGSVGSQGHSQAVLGLCFVRLFLGNLEQMSIYPR